MDLSVVLFFIFCSVIFSLSYKLFTIIGLIFAKLLIIVSYGVLAILVFIGYPIPQDSLFMVIFLPFIYNFLDLFIFNKLENFIKNNKEKNKDFNEPKYSPNGCLVGNTSGKNDTETIMKIINKSTKK